jgi:hypothetical protein
MMRKMTLAAGLAAGLLALTAMQLPGEALASNKLAEQAYAERAQTAPRTANVKTCAAWWLHAPSNPPKTGKGKTGPTPEHKRKSTKHEPPPKSSQR